MSLHKELDNKNVVHIQNEALSSCKKKIPEIMKFAENRWTQKYNSNWSSQTKMKPTWSSPIYEFLAYNVYKCSSKKQAVFPPPD